MAAPTGSGGPIYHLVPDCVTSNAVCTLCDLVNMLITYIRIVLAGISGVALLMFVIGGFMLIISSGNQERVAKGRKILTAAITGVLIVSFTWVGINALVGTLIGTEMSQLTNETLLFPDNTVYTFPDTGEFTRPWWQLPTCAYPVHKESVEVCSEDNAKLQSPCGSCSWNDIEGTGECLCMPDAKYKKSFTYQQFYVGIGKATNNTCLYNKDNICKCMSKCEAFSWLQGTAYECVPTDTARNEGSGDWWGWFDDYVCDGPACPSSTAALTGSQVITHRCCRPK